MSVCHWSVKIVSTLSLKTIDVIQREYPGQAVLTTDQIARVLGKTGKAGAQTIRNQISSGKFPLADKIKKVGGRNVLSAALLANWIDGEVETSEPDKPAVKKRGRPRKIVMEWIAELETEWQKMLDEHAADLGSVMAAGTGTGWGPGL